MKPTAQAVGTSGTMRSPEGAKDESTAILAAHPVAILENWKSTGRTIYAPAIRAASLNIFTNMGRVSLPVWVF